MRIITKIIIHCAATPPSMDVGTDTIRRWHTDPPPKGNGWDDIGYHYVIRRDGTVEDGRPLAKPGAHCQGHNADSIGVCLVGGTNTAGKPENNYTPQQWQSLTTLTARLMAEHTKANLYGHSDFNPGKACPCFDVRAWWAKVLRGDN